MKIESFYHEQTNTLSYVVFDQVGGNAVVIDSALDLLVDHQIWSFEFMERQIECIQDNNLTLDWILETHTHADHASAAFVMQKRLGGQRAVSRHIVDIQKTYKETIRQIEPTCSLQGKEFDKLLTDGDVLQAGELSIIVLDTPGHTPDGVTFLIGEHAFVGDTLFMPDSGTARCDFPKGCAKKLFKSIKRILALPDSTTLWVCHDYQPYGRDLRCSTTVLETREHNIYLKEKSKKQFVSLRETRDKSLGKPRLLDKALPINLLGGKILD